MSTAVIAPSPVARLMLELEARAATGGLEVGGRRIVLDKGAIIEVRPADSDPSLGDFLLATGRLTETELESSLRAASQEKNRLEVVLQARGLVPAEILEDTRRALWLDRFVRGLAADESQGRQPGPLTPEPQPNTARAVSTLPFVLDALARRAGLAGDAESVGRLADRWFAWLDTPLRARASIWAELGGIDGPVPTSSLFTRHPAAASRIAALVRAGLAHLGERDILLPQPAPRPPAITAPSSIPPPRRSSRPPPSLPPSYDARRLLRRPLDLQPLDPWFPDSASTLEDPLEPLERRISKLEQMEADGPERARAWLDLARGFLTHFDCIDEAARASREAAAADPQNPAALDLAAALCASVCRPDLAYCYAQALAGLLHDPADRAQALVRSALYAARAGDTSGALDAFKAAHETRPEDPGFAERYARALFAHGDVTRAKQLSLVAARGYRPTNPESARALLAWANEIDAADSEVASEYASALAADGFAEAAAAVLARTARLTQDTTLGSRLFREAAVRAELAARPDLAADLLIEGVQTHGFVEPLAQALMETLIAAGAVTELALVAEELAQGAHGAVRAACLCRAADARLELPGELSTALELYTQALIAAPDNEHALDAIGRLAASKEHPHALTDALERALASSVSPAAQAVLAEQLLAASRRDPARPALEEMAWSILRELHGRPATDAERAAHDERARRFELELHALEEALRRAPAETRTTHALAYAERLRSVPEKRKKARKIYDKVLALEPSNQHAAAGLDALLRLEQDAAALVALLKQRATHAPQGFARLSAQLALVREQRARGQLAQATDDCLSLLEQAPKSGEALLLLHHLALETGSPSLLREALARRAEASRNPRERARLLATLARAHAREHDGIEALRLSESALAADPRCAEAALLIVEHESLLDPARGVSALRLARTALSDTPTVLRLIAQACYGAHDPRGQLEALEALLRLSAYDPLPALGLCTLLSTGHDAHAIREAAARLLSPERFCDASTDALRAALARLWTLGAIQQAAELALQASDALGEAATPLVPWTLPYVREGADPRLARAVLERIVARAEGATRRAELRRLAHFAHEHGDHTTEARTYLRLLAVEPSDHEALHRLSEIYAETRELDRLSSLLTLRLDMTSEAEERRELLLSLAATTLARTHDAAATKDLVMAALASQLEEELWSEPTLDAIRRGIGLLLGGNTPRAAFEALVQLSEDASPERRRVMLEEAVFLAQHDLHDSELGLRAASLGLEAFPTHAPFLVHFEHIAHRLGDVATAREVYRHVADCAMGKNARGAVLLRASRWFERAGAPVDALSTMEQAFALTPREGRTLKRLERLARAGGDLRALVRALLAVARESEDPERRAAILERAAALCEDELGDAQEACALYLRAYDENADPELELRCLDRLLSVHDSDPETGRALADRLRDTFTAHAKEHSSPPLRMRALLGLGQLALDVYHFEDDAAGYLQAVRELLQSEQALSVEQTGVLEARLEQLSARLPEQRKGASSPRVSQRPAGGQPSISPSAPAQHDGASAPPIPAAAAPARPPVGGAPTAAAVAPSPRGPQIALLTAEEDAVIQGILAGAIEALFRLAEQPADLDRSAQVCDVLLDRTRASSPNLVALRALRLLSERIHRKDLLAVTSELLAQSDPTLILNQRPRVPDPADEATKSALLEARDDGDLHHAFAILGHVYLGGGPLFRRSLSTYGVSASDFLAPRDENSWAMALRDVASVLGVEHEVYVSPSGKDRLTVASTYPPAIIVGDRTPQDPVALRFRFAHAFELARPTSVLLATLSPDAASTLLAAIRAAFGPSDPTAAAVGREPAAMAAELWRTMPASTQHQVSNILRSSGMQLPCERLRAQMQLRGARVGLVAAGAFNVALRHLGSDGDGASGLALNSEAALSRALESQPLVQGLARFALSDAYLAVRSRESS